MMAVAPPRFSWKVPVAIVVVLALAGLAGWAVASAAGDRTPGQSATGSVPQSGNPIDTKLATARDLIGQKKIVDAIKTYDDVLRDDPNQPEALAYRGWLLYLAGLGDQGLDSVTKATQADPSYPDAHFFRGQMLCQMQHDNDGAVTEFRGYLSRVNPQDQSLVPLVEARLKSAMNGECTNATAPAPATP
jgi:tetratricopeptide (TPR) repeat protein